MEKGESQFIARQAIKNMASPIPEKTIDEISALPTGNMSMSLSSVLARVPKTPRIETPRRRADAGRNFRAGIVPEVIVRHQKSAVAEENCRSDDANQVDHPIPHLN